MGKKSRIVKPHYTIDDNRLEYSEATLQILRAILTNAVEAIDNGYIRTPRDAGWVCAHLRDVSLMENDDGFDETFNERHSNYIADSWRDFSAFLQRTDGFTVSWMCILSEHLLSNEDFNELQKAPATPA